MRALLPGKPQRSRISTRAQIRRQMSQQASICSRPSIISSQASALEAVASTNNHASLLLCTRRPSPYKLLIDDRIGSISGSSRREIENRFGTWRVYTRLPLCLPARSFGQRVSLQPELFQTSEKPSLCIVQSISDTGSDTSPTLVRQTRDAALSRRLCLRPLSGPASGISLPVNPSQTARPSNVKQISVTVYEIGGTV